MQDTAIAHAGDPIFVRVVDLDRNRDGTVVETVDVRVTARSHWRFGSPAPLRDRSEYRRVRGLHADHAGLGRCRLRSRRSSATRELDATYVDPTDSSDAAQADALVDPYGLVFDSQTGAADQRRASAPHRRHHRP